MKRAVFEAIARSRVGQTWDQGSPYGLLVVLEIESITQRSGWVALYNVLWLNNEVGTDPFWFEHSARPWEGTDMKLM